MTFNVTDLSIGWLLTYLNSVTGPDLTKLNSSVDEF